MATQTNDIATIKGYLVSTYVFARGSGLDITQSLHLVVNTIGIMAKEDPKVSPNLLFREPFAELQDHHGTILKAVLFSDQLNPSERQALIECMQKNGLVLEVNEVGMSFSSMSPTLE